MVNIHKKEIENILLEATNINGKPTGIKISDILHFPDLKHVTLQNFLIDDNAIKIINKHSRLTTITFVNCKFNCKEFEYMEKNPETMKFFNCKNIPKYLPKIENLYFSRCNIDFNSIDFNVLLNLKIEYSNIKNVYNIEEKDNVKNIEIFESKLFSDGEKEIKEIKVSKKTTFSNAKKEIEFSEGMDIY